MRRFYLHRIEDKTGISGIGIVVEGVVFSNGWVVMTWLTDTSSVVIYSSIEDVEKIHGHNGATELIWIDAAVSPLRPKELEG